MIILLTKPKPQNVRHRYGLTENTKKNGNILCTNDMLVGYNGCKLWLGTTKYTSNNFVTHSNNSVLHRAKHSRDTTTKDDFHWKNKWKLLKCIFCANF